MGFKSSQKNGKNHWSHLRKANIRGTRTRTKSSYTWILSPLQSSFASQYSNTRDLRGPSYSTPLGAELDLVNYHPKFKEGGINQLITSNGTSLTCGETVWDCDRNNGMKRIIVIFPVNSNSSQVLWQRWWLQEKKSSRVVICGISPGDFVKRCIKGVRILGTADRVKEIGKKNLNFPGFKGWSSYNWRDFPTQVEQCLR